MEMDLPFGPWEKIFSAQWKNYPLQILENPDHLLLVLLFEKKDNEVSGILVLQRKPFLIDGDLSKVMLAQKRDLTFIEKRSAASTQSYVLIDATPGFVAYQQEALEAEIAKQYAELESVGKLLKKSLEGTGHVKVTDAKKADTTQMQPLLGDPASLLALLQGKAVPLAESDAKAPLGMDLHSQVADVPLQKMRGSTVVGGTREKRLHVLHVLIENALLNHTPCLVFDTQNAFAGLASPNPDGTGLEHYAQDKPVGFALKEYHLGKGMYIDLSFVEPALFLAAFALEKSNVAPVISKAYEAGRGRLFSASELAGEVLKTPETRETPRFLIQRAARILQVIHKSYSAVFAKNASEELTLPWKEESGKVIRITLSDYKPEIAELASYALLKSISANSPSGFTLLVAFEPNASQLTANTLRVVRELYKSGVGFALHDDHENGFGELGKATLQVEIVGNDVIVGTEGETNKKRVILRPAYSQCAEFTTLPRT